MCFVPNEACYVAALDRDPRLLEHGAGKGVLIATPTTLLALLHATHYGWRQAEVEESALDIAAAGRELHKRCAAFLDAYAKVGRQLASATEAYNSSVGSLEGRVLPQLRRFEELGAQVGEGARRSEAHRHRRAGDRRARARAGGAGDQRHGRLTADLGSGGMDRMAVQQPAPSGEPTPELDARDWAAQDGPRLSPSALNRFLGCEYRTYLDILERRGELDAEPRPPKMELLFERGDAP